MTRLFLSVNTVKPALSGLRKKTKFGFKTDYRLMQVKSQESILQYFLPFVFKTFVLSIFEWPLKTGFSV